MTYLDTETVHTDWSEPRRLARTERCPLTGVPAALHRRLTLPCDDELADGLADREGQPNSKLQAMFDKFLYQK